MTQTVQQRPQYRLPHFMLERYPSQRAFNQAQQHAYEAGERTRARSQGRNPAKIQLVPATHDEQEDWEEGQWRKFERGWAPSLSSEMSTHGYIPNNIRPSGNRPSSSAATGRSINHQYPVNARATSSSQNQSIRRQHQHTQQQQRHQSSENASSSSPPPPRRNRHTRPSLLQEMMRGQTFLGERGFGRSEDGGSSQASSIGRETENHSDIDDREDRVGDEYYDEADNYGDEPDDSVDERNTDQNEEPSTCSDPNCLECAGDQVRPGQSSARSGQRQSGGARRSEVEILDDVDEEEPEGGLRGNQSEMRGRGGNIRPEGRGGWHMDVDSDSEPVRRHSGQMRSGQEELDRSRDRHINLPAPAPPFILRPPSNRINLNGARSTQTSATNEQRRRTRSGYAENETSRPEIRRHSMGGMAMGMTSRQSQSNSGQLNSRRSSASGVHDNNRLGRNTFDGRNQPQHPSSLRQSFSVNHRSGADRDNNMMDQDRDDDNVEHFSDGEEQEENRRRQAGHPVRTDMHDSRGSRFGTESMVSDIDEDDVGGDYYGEDYSNEGDEGEDWHVHTNGVNGAGRRSSVRSGWREDRGDQRDVDEDEDMGVEDGPHGDDRLRSNTQHVPPPHRRSNASIHTQQPSNNHFTTRAAASSHVTGAAHRRSSGGRVRRSSSSGSDGGEAPTSTRSNKRVRISESSIRRDSNPHSRQAGGDEDDWELDIEADIRDLQAVPGVEQQGLLGRMCEQYSRQLEQYTQILPEAKRAALRSYRKLLESAMVQTTKALAAFFLSLPRPDRPDPHNPLLFADSLSFIEDVPFARPIPLRHPLAITSGIAHRLNKLARIWAVAVERSGRNYLLAVDADHTCGYDVPVDQLEATLAMSKSLIIELKEMIRSLPALLEETFGVRVTFGFGDREGQQVGSARLAQERLSKALRTAIASWNAVGVNMRANVDNPRVFNKLHHVFIEDMTQMLSALYTMTYLPYQCTVWIDTSNQIVPLSGLYTANLGREQIGGGNRPS